MKGLNIFSIILVIILTLITIIVIVEALSKETVLYYLNQVSWSTKNLDETDGVIETLEPFTSYLSQNTSLIDIRPNREDTISQLNNNAIKLISSRENTLQTTPNTNNIHFQYYYSGEINNTLPFPGPEAYYVPSEQVFLNSRGIHANTSTFVSY